LLATAVLEMAAVLGAAAFPSTFDGSTNAHVVPPASLRTRRNNFDDPATTIADLVARPSTVFGILCSVDNKPRRVVCEWKTHRVVDQYNYQDNYYRSRSPLRHVGYPMASARSSWSWFEIGNDSGVRLGARKSIDLRGTTVGISIVHPPGMAHGRPRVPSIERNRRLRPCRLVAR
jgi:hypothetical protein